MSPDLEPNLPQYSVQHPSHCGSMRPTRCGDKPATKREIKSVFLNREICRVFVSCDPAVWCPPAQPLFLLLSSLSPVKSRWVSQLPVNVSCDCESDPAESLRSISSPELQLILPTATHYWFWLTSHCHYCHCSNQLRVWRLFWSTNFEDQLY